MEGRRNHTLKTRHTTPPLFAYNQTVSPLHGIPAGFKIPFIFLLAIPVYSSLAGALGIVTVLVSLTALISRLSLSSWSKTIRIALFWGIFIFVFRIAGSPLTPDTLIGNSLESALYMWRMWVLILSGTVFFETTTSLEIRYALETYQRMMEKILSTILFRPIHLSNTAFLLSLTLSFIPRIFRVWLSLELSWEARCGNSRNPVQAFRKISTLLPLLLARLFAMAAETDAAIQNRFSLK